MVGVLADAVHRCRSPRWSSASSRPPCSTGSWACGEAWGSTSCPSGPTPATPSWKRSRPGTWWRCCATATSATAASRSRSSEKTTLPSARQCWRCAPAPSCQPPCTTGVRGPTPGPAPVATDRRGTSADVARVTQTWPTAEELISRAPDQWHLMQPTGPATARKPRSAVIPSCRQRSGACRCHADRARPACSAGSEPAGGVPSPRAHRAGLPLQPHGPGGVQAQVLGLAQMLRSLGYDTRVLAPATARRPTRGRRWARACPRRPTGRSRRSRPILRRSSARSGHCATKRSTCSTCTSRSRPGRR
jgi:hypothetical protein